MVQITICWGSELKGSEADVVQGFIIDTISFIRVFNQLMDGEGGIVRLDDRIGDFWRGDNGKGVHDSVWVFLTDLGDQEGAHTGTSTTSKGVCKLESLKNIFNKLIFGVTNNDFNRNFGQKSKLWSNIEIFVKNQKFWIKIRNFGQKSIFWSNSEILVKNPYFGQKAKFWSKIEILIKD